MAGTALAVEVTTSGTVRDLREAVVEKSGKEVPPACIMKIVNGTRALLDPWPISVVDKGQQLFCVVARDTNVEALLSAAGTYQGYADAFQAAADAATAEGAAQGGPIAVGPLPTILAVL